MQPEDSPTSTYASNEGYATLKQQWMSLITAHHPISSTEWVPLNLALCMQFAMHCGEMPEQWVKPGSVIEEHGY